MLTHGRMGLADRDYQRTPPRTAGGGFMSRLTPVVKWLLIINVGIFFLDHAILPVFFNLPPEDYPLTELGAFSIRSGLLHLHLWEFVTFQFLHAHLLQQ